MSFNSELIDLQKTDPRFVDDVGELILAAVQDRCQTPSNQNLLDPNSKNSPRTRPPQNVGRSTTNWAFLPRG